MAGNEFAPAGREAWPPRPPGSQTDGQSSKDDTPSVGHFLAHLMSSTADMLDLTPPERVEDIAGVVGEGESADGMVRVSYSEDAPVSGLRLHPRALDLGTEGVADAVREAVRAAMVDQLARKRELTAGGDHGIADQTGTRDLEAARREAENTATGMSETAQDLFASVSQLRQSATRPVSYDEK